MSSETVEKEQVREEVGLPEAHRPHPLDAPLTIAHAAMAEHLSRSVTGNFIGYQVVIRLNIAATDDVMAREMAKGIVPLLSQNANVKLQKVYRDRQPEALSL